MHPTRVYLRLKKRVWGRPDQVLRVGEIAQVLVDESFQEIKELGGPPDYPS